VRGGGTCLWSECPIPSWSSVYSQTLQSR